MGLYTPPLILDVPEQTYAGTIVWTGTTAPSSTTTHTYQWSQDGKLVTLRINLKYAVAGSALTGVTMTLPSDCPTPFIPSGFNAADNNLLNGTGQFFSSLTGTSTTAIVRAFLRINSSNNGYLLAVYSSASAAFIGAYATVQYWAA